MINRLVNLCHKNAVRHGFWETHGEEKKETALLLSKIALIHSELSELVEYARKDPSTRSDHIPEITGVEEELADAVIRIFDLAGYLHVNLGRAIALKMEFNRGRPYMHGKKA